MDERRHHTSTSYVVHDMTVRSNQTMPIRSWLSLHDPLMSAVLIAICVSRAAAFSSRTLANTNQRKSALYAASPAAGVIDRPLLREFGRAINERVRNSRRGYNRFGITDDHYTSDETIPCLTMQSNSAVSVCGEVATRAAIRRAYTANDNQNRLQREHGRSSGSGCTIIRLRGKDASSVRGLVNFADNFFDGVDDDTCNADINNIGVFRIENNVHAGFDNNVNNEDKMQVLYTKTIPPKNSEDVIGDPVLLPLEVGELVGQKSVNKAHSGMATLADVGSQITSAILGMDGISTKKLLDDCTRADTSISGNISEDFEINEEGRALLREKFQVSNSYQRLIRYLKPPPPQQAKVKTEDDAAFWPHVDSTFLTLIPMPEIAGLEVWCPSSKNAECIDMAQRGEWVRPLKPGNERGLEDESSTDMYVVALAGEFLQLLSNGDVPTCIHRVIAPKAAESKNYAKYGEGEKQYKARVSAPLFLRPRKGEEAVLDIASDLNTDAKPLSSGLYFEEGLLEECDEMRVWDYMDCMSPNN